MLLLAAVGGIPRELAIDHSLHRWMKMMDDLSQSLLDS
jgi:hypothetical protein